MMRWSGAGGAACAPVLPHIGLAVVVLAAVAMARRAVASVGEVTDTVFSFAEAVVAGPLTESERNCQPITLAVHPRGALDQFAGWFEDYNENHPRCGLRMRSPRDVRSTQNTADVSG